MRKAIDARIKKIPYSGKSLCGFMAYYFTGRTLITVDKFRHDFNGKKYEKLEDNNQGLLQVLFRDEKPRCIA